MSDTPFDRDDQAGAPSPSSTGGSAPSTVVRRAAPAPVAEPEPVEEPVIEPASAEPPSPEPVAAAPVAEPAPVEPPSPEPVAAAPVEPPAPRTGSVEEESFEALFEANPVVPEQRHLRPGDRVTGRITSVTDEIALVDIGAKTEGIVFVSELLGKDGEIDAHEGDELEPKVVSVGPGGIQPSQGMRLHGSQEALALIEDAHLNEIPIEGKVVGTNKGGFDVEIGKVRAFCPISQMDLARVEDPTVFIGLKDLFKVTQFAEGGRRVVVSRRALLEVTRQARIDELKDRLFEGEELEGTVTRLQPFGAFVDLGGLEGLVHVSELSRQRVESPAEVVTVGQTVRVKVLRMDEDEKGRTRVGLSMKALEADPWDVGLPFGPDAILKGKVARLQPFGAFVELMPGVDGLVHVSEIAWERISHPGAKLTEGQEVSVKVLSLDYERRRVSLSIKQTDMAGAPAARAATDAPEQAPSERPAVGQVHEGIVDNVKPYGVFVNLPRLGGRARGLLPNEEIEGSTTDLRRRFAQGSTVTVEIITIDDQGRLRLSQRAMADREERENLATFEKASAPKKPASGLGSFGALLQQKLGK